MQLIKETFKYIKSRFFSLILYAILPGVLFGLFSNPTTIYNYLYGGYVTSTNISFYEIYSNMTEILNWKKVLAMLLGMIIIAVSLSAAGGTIDRHFRIGEFKMNQFRRYVNRNFISVLMALIIMLVILEIYGLLITLIAYFWKAILVRHVSVALGLTLCAVCVLSVIMAWIYAKLILVLPHTMITGISPLKAIPQVIDVLDIKKSWNLFIALVLPTLPFFALEMVLFSLVYSNFPNHPGYKALECIINIMIYSLASLYYIVLMFVAYFDVMNMERADKNSIWRKY